jgi:RNA polymerase sigma-B factor
MDVVRRPRAGEDLDALAERFAELLQDADDRAAHRHRDDFVVAMLPFAMRLAHRYRGRGELADLEQVAGLGLVKAVDRYEPARGSFTAFAILTIAGELKRHFRDHTWGMHVPRRVQELVAEVQAAVVDLRHELGREPTDAEVARRCAVEVHEINEARRSADAYRPSSLNRPIGEEGHELGDLLGSADPAIDRVPDLLTVRRLVQHLPPRICRLLTMRFFEDRTQAEIAAELGISQMHVSRLLSRAMEWMRAALLDDEAPPWPGNEPDPLGGRLSIAERVVSAGEIVVRVTGEIDRDNAGRLREMLVRSVQRTADNGTVVCELSAVPFLDAAGVGALRGVADVARVRGVTLRVAGLRPQLRRIVDICGLTTLA